MARLLAVLVGAHRDGGGRASSRAACEVGASQRQRWAARGAAAARHHVPDPQAEQLYLKGIYYWQKRTPESLNQVVDYFTAGGGA